MLSKDNFVVVFFPIIIVVRSVDSFVQLALFGVKSDGSRFFFFVVIVVLSSVRAFEMYFSILHRYGKVC